MTEIIQTGLQCGTSYYTRVIVIGEPRYQGVPEEQLLFSSQVQLLIGGKEIACMRFQSQQPDGGYFITHAAIPILFGMRAKVTAENARIRVSWEWSCQGVLELTTNLREAL